MKRTLVISFLMIVGQSFAQTQKIGPIKLMVSNGVYGFDKKFNNLKLNLNIGFQF